MKLIWTVRFERAKNGFVNVVLYSRWGECNPIHDTERILETI